MVFALTYGIAIAMMLIFALLNRARGTQLFDLTSSTELGRIVCVLGMGITCMALADFRHDDLAHIGLIGLWVSATLLLWVTFGWDNYWSAAIGNPTDITKPVTWMVDAVMKHLRWLPLRAWGTVAMGLRQAYDAPCLIGLALLSGHPWHATYLIGSFFLGIPYLLGGWLTKTYPIAFAEYSVGALRGGLFFLVMS